MTYWHYTYMTSEGNKLFYGFGVMKSDYDGFDFVSFYDKHPNNAILSVTQIPESQFNKLHEIIDRRIKRQNNDENL